MMTPGLAVFVIAASTAKLGADANTKTNGSNIEPLAKVALREGFFAAGGKGGGGGRPFLA